VFSTVQALSEVCHDKSLHLFTLPLLALSDEWHAVVAMSDPTASLAKVPLKTLLLKHRIDALSDGVFAVAMTLLVLELKIPDLDRHASAGDLLQALRPMWPTFYSFVITFILAAIFWELQQSVLNAAREMTRLATFESLATLMFVSLLPFSTGILGRYVSNRAAQGIYFGNMFLIAATIAAHWFTLKRQGSRAAMERQLELKTTFRVYSLTAASLVAVLASLRSITLAQLGFVLVILASRIYQKRALKI
jgi:uncharacterized membrane protein